MLDLKSFLELFDKFAPWSLILAGVFVCATIATLAKGYIRTPPTSETIPISDFFSHDNDINDIQLKIGKIIGSSKYPDETLILAQLKRLFERAGFINYATGNPKAQLYDFCITLMIVRENLQYFKTNHTRQTLLQIVGKLDSLETIAQDNFLSLNVSDHVRRYIKNQDDFLNNLPMDRGGQEYFVKYISPREQPLIADLKSLCNSIM